jgi:CS domain
METYTWTQTLSEVSLSVEVGDAGKREIELEIDSGLSLRVRGKSLIQGHLHSAVNEDGSTWTLENGRLEIFLEKREKDWWPCVVKGHKEIDTRDIEPESSSLHDLDPETRVMVEKMLLEGRMKESPPELEGNSQ